MKRADIEQKQGLCDGERKTKFVERTTGKWEERKSQRQRGFVTARLSTRRKPIRRKERQTEIFFSLHCDTGAQ